MKNKYSPIGLDIGRTAIRAIQLCRRGVRLEVQSALESRYDDDFIVKAFDGEDETYQTYISEQLGGLIRRGGFVGSNVVMHCPSDKLDIRPIDLPIGSASLDRRAVLGALRLKMATHLPFDIEQGVFDYFVLGQNSDSNVTTFMAVTADGDWIKQRINIAHSLGLQCIAVDAHPCVLARLLDHIIADTPVRNDDVAPVAQLQQGDTNSVVSNKLQGVLDIGYSGSTLIVLKSGIPVFCRRFALGGKELSDVLVQRLAVSYKQAENLKLTYGFDSHARRLRLVEQGATDNTAVALAPGGPEEAYDAPASQHAEISKTIYTALQGELSDYVKGLTRALNYVISENSGSSLEKILLCGSAGHTRNIDHFLGKEFELPVEILSHPLLGEIIEYLPTTRAFTGTWATALGLALREVTS